METWLPDHVQVHPSRIYFSSIPGIALTHRSKSWNLLLLLNNVLFTFAEPDLTWVHSHSWIPGCDDVMHRDSEEVALFLFKMLFVPSMSNNFCTVSPLSHQPPACPPYETIRYCWEWQQTITIKASWPMVYIYLLSTNSMLLLSQVLYRCQLTWFL